MEGGKWFPAAGAALRYLRLLRISQTEDQVLFVLPEFVAQKRENARKRMKKREREEEKKENHALFTVQPDWVSVDHVMKDNFLFLLLLLTRH